MEITLSAPPSQPAVVWDFVPNTEALEKAGDDGGWAQSLVGRVNRVEIGTPLTYDLISMWNDATPLSDQIKATLDKSDYLLVRMACSFMPDMRCRFTWGRFSAQFACLDESEPPHDVLTFDLYPRDITEQTLRTRKLSLDPSLKMTFGEASLNMGYAEERMIFEPRVSGAGLLSRTASWTFQAEGHQGGLAGSREMYAIIRKTKGCNACVRFSVTAEVHGRLGPIPVRQASGGGQSSPFRLQVD
ncbi:hypothetical protein VOI32_37725 [Paraburkholderia caribensis]|uniref:Uncharacterized protein n=2 Tax=Paraburkholderia TaxID=1822464 RepID=B2JXC9_PARP8|nr:MULTISPECIES: hypothetical protein [Paraburkholderia]ACC76287.1 hypothetical protein Bphy_7302 [Paraburkholderia phymatum STM815]MCO4882344.1 hypothetical protein [Paraburkholderia caribensis]PTB24305.1 hypothetical protein C9I56_34500 [Paraburkholderia caribensis]